jgi:E3 ubiquitin-protein ligase EDD1
MLNVLVNYMMCLFAGLDGNSARRDFLTYALSLMRSHNAEHSDTLPVIDISALKHVAYVFDALIYYMRSGTDSDVDVIRDGISVHSWQDHDENENEDQDDDPVNQSVGMETDSMDGESDIGGKSGRKHPFFQRSDSTTFLGCPPPDPFHTPLVEALPLADQPHLLQPNSRKEELFGMPRQQVTPDVQLQTQPSPFDKLPTHLALSVRTAETPYAQAGPPALYGHGSGTALEVPSCSTQNVQNVDSSRPSTSVIVKPASQPASSSSDLQSQTCIATPSIETSSIDIAASTPSAEMQGIESVPSPTERPLMTQASVIVHTGSGQPIALAPGTSSEKAIVPEEQESDSVAKKAEDVASEVAQEVQISTSPPSVHSNPQPEASTSTPSTR